MLPVLFQGLANGQYRAYQIAEGHVYGLITDGALVKAVSPWTALSYGVIIAPSLADPVVWVVLLGGAVAVLVTCWLVAGRLARPLRSMLAATKELGPQNLGRRVGSPKGRGELAELADSINAMLDRLSTGFDAQVRFAANASHELRTPLAVQRMLVELAIEEPDAGPELGRLGRQLLRANERNERLIEGLLVLAESERGVQGTAPVRLDELAADVVAAHREPADGSRVRLESALAGRTVLGDAVLLERMITNLVQNAVKYNEPGGWVRVTTTGEAALTVSNSGPTVPATEVPALFEPFRRLNRTRLNTDGAGLGLSIVRSIVTAHGGTVRAEPGDHGGLVVEVHLPPA